MKFYAILLAICCGFLTISAQPLQGNSIPESQIDSSKQIADRITNTTLPVLIYFWAPWCKPCGYLEPVVKEIEEQYQGRIFVEKANIEIHKKLANYFKVNSLPSVYLVKGRTALKYLPGYNPKEKYIKLIEEILITP